MRRLGLIIAASALLFATGCAHVKPWERDQLAREDMAWTPDPVEAAFRSHVYFSKEASLPGGGAGGGPTRAGAAGIQTHMTNTWNTPIEALELAYPLKVVRTSLARNTGGGGRHIYFSHPGGMVRNKVGLAAGIDLRGDGGCVVAPPSVHASGKVYTWLEGHDPEQAKLAPMPGWLLAEITGVPQRRGHTLDYWRNLVREGVPEGERNNTIASLAGHLLWHGVDPDVVQELLLCWNRVRCHPPLSDEEVARTVDSITRLHER